MAPSKQHSRPSKGKDLFSDAGEEDPTRLVSEPGEGGANFLSNLEELAHFNKVQYHLLSVLADMSAKCDLLLQANMENGGDRGILENREGIGTSHVRVPAFGLGTNDQLQGNWRNFQGEEQAVFSGGRPQQGLTRMERSAMSSGGRPQQCPRSSVEPVRQNVQEGFYQVVPNEDCLKESKIEDQLQGIYHNHLQEDHSMSPGNKQHSWFRGGRDHVRQNAQENAFHAAPNKDGLKGSRMSVPKFDRRQSMIIEDEGFDLGHSEESKKSEQTAQVKRKEDKWSNSVKVTGNRSDLSRTKPSQQGYMDADDLPGDPYDPGIRNRKWNSIGDFNPSMIALEPKARVYGSFSSQLSNSYFPYGQKTKKIREKIAKKFSHNGGRYNERFEFNPSKETELDSSEQISDDVDFNLTSKKLKSKFERDLMKASELHRKDNNKAVEELQRLPEIEIFTSKGKQKGRNNQLHYNLNDNSDERSFQPTVHLQVDGNGLQSLGSVSEGHDEYTERSSQALAKAISNKQHRLKVELGYSSPHSSFMAVDNMKGMNYLLEEAIYAKRRGKKIESVDTDSNEFDECEDTSVSVIARNYNMDEPTHPPSKSQWAQKETGSAKKKGKKKGDNEALPVTSLALDVDAPKVQPGDIEQNTKSQKKTYTLITPSIHTGFPFSVVHLLSAVRIAMTASTFEDIVERGELEQTTRVEYADGLVSDNYVQATTDIPEQAGASSLPPMAIQEIVNRVKLNPCDPCIMETQEPLLDLIRGMLRIFCSKTTPLGAIGWKAFVSYDKGTKCWTWVGPVTSALPDNDPVEKTSPTVWGIPHKMLVKLADGFANWLKNAQETLQQIGCLHDPPLMFMPHVEEKERFKDLRAQKSLTAISPSVEEVNEYFHKEEYLRYRVPDRAFSYTAIDGKKSIVTPLRRCGGKPISKARDHFMLKLDNNVTILCLVREVAARIPGSIGTRAVVGTLIRDSQNVTETVFLLIYDTMDNCDVVQQTSKGKTKLNQKFNCHKLSMDMNTNKLIAETCSETVHLIDVFFWIIQSVELKYVLLLLWNQTVCCGNMEPKCVFDLVDNNRDSKVALRDILCGFSSLRTSHGDNALQLCFSDV